MSYFHSVRSTDVVGISPLHVVLVVCMRAGAHTSV